MDTPASRFGLAVDRQARNLTELKSDVEADRPDRRLVAEARADGVVQIAETNTPGIRPDVAAVEKQHAAEIADERRPQLGREREHAVAADRQPRFAERAHLVASPAANRGRAAEEVLLRKRHQRRVAVRGIDVAHLRAVGPHERPADRQVVATVREHQEVAERAGEESSRLLGVKRRLVAAAGIEQVVRGRALHIETERRHRPELRGRARIEAQRDQVVAQLRIGEHVGRNRALVALGRQGHRPRRGGARPVVQRDAAADDVRAVGRRIRVPILPGPAERKVRREEIRLRELEPDAAVERRPARVRGCRARAAQEVHVPVLGVDARLLLAPVADAELGPLVVAFGNGHPRRHLVRLLVHFRRLHRDELEQLHPIQTALRLLDQTAAIQIARLVGELTLDHPLADAAVAGDRDRSEVRQLAGLGVERDVGILARRAAEPFVDRDTGVREAVIAQLVERELLGGDHLLPIAGLARLERHRLLHRAEVFRRDDREAVEVHVRDPDGLAFRDRQCHVDRRPACCSALRRTT